MINTGQVNLRQKSDHSALLKYNIVYIVLCINKIHLTSMTICNSKSYYIIIIII